MPASIPATPSSPANSTTSSTNSPPYLRRLHVHDNRGHSDEHCPPGDGRIDWGAFLRELIQVHFHGAFILEIAGG
ncbi:MAG: sugar phosphate isomerase/epimerase family protein, partial [Spartobacteria bacterium]